MKKTKGATPKLRDKWIREWLRRLEEGRYEPFLRTEDVRSSGNRARVPGIKSPGRVHHCMSYGETLCLCWLEWDNSVTGIWEQYALLPVTETVAIARELGVRHPRYPNSRTDLVMTSDFLVERSGGAQCVYSVKAAGALDDQRTREKLRIEQIYWERRGVDWILVTDAELRKQANENALLLHGFAMLDADLLQRRAEWLHALSEDLSEHREDRLASVVERTSQRLGLDYADSVHILYHAIWHRLVCIDLDQPVRLEYSANQLGVKVDAGY